MSFIIFKNIVFLWDLERMVSDIVFLWQRKGPDSFLIFKPKQEILKIRILKILFCNYLPLVCSLTKSKFWTLSQ